MHWFWTGKFTCVPAYLQDDTLAPKLRYTMLRFRTLATDLPVHTAPEGRPLGRRPCDCCVDLVAAVREACLPDCLDLLPSVMIYYCLGNEPHLALDCPHFNALRTKYETKLRFQDDFRAFMQQPPGVLASYLYCLLRARDACIHPAS